MRNEHVLASHQRDGFSRREKWASNAAVAWRRRPSPLSLAPSMLLLGALRERLLYPLRISTIPLVFNDLRPFNPFPNPANKGLREEVKKSRSQGYPCLSNQHFSVDWRAFTAALSHFPDIVVSQAVPAIVAGRFPRIEDRTTTVVRIWPSVSVLQEPDNSRQPLFTTRKEHSR